MIVEGEYFYKGVQRLSWGFGSPNQLGAFFAGVIPFLWALSPAGNSPAKVPPPPTKERRRRVPEPRRRFPLRLVTTGGILAMELALWIGLGATASRGAAVAALGAAAAWSAARMIATCHSWLKTMGWLTARMVMCLGGMAIFSFGGRIAPEFLARDASIGHRFILWSGAARLIAAAPWTGWGVGESGNAFTQWVQPLDRAERYRTMVNSFLHVGVERGLPALGFLLFLTLLGVSWAFMLERHLANLRLRLFVRASSAVLLSWALSNVFSTLFRDWRLWIFPALAFALLIASVPWLRVPFRRVGAWLLCSSSAAILACAGLWLIGWRLEAQPTIHLAHPAKGLVLLRSGARISDAQWGLLVDPVVFGPRYGHEIRRWGESLDPGTPWSVVVVDGRFWRQTFPQVKPLKSWILVGETAQAADDLAANDYLVFLHPRGQPPRNWSGTGIVVFNGIDEEGTREAWMDWAVRRHLRIETVASVGLDARAEWPDAYAKELVATP